jgi:hypothetical protein
MPVAVELNGLLPGLGPGRGGPERGVLERGTPGRGVPGPPGRGAPGRGPWVPWLRVPWPPWVPWLSLGRGPPPWPPWPPWPPERGAWGRPCPLPGPPVGWPVAGAFADPVAGAFADPVAGAFADPVPGPRKSAGVAGVRGGPGTRGALLLESPGPGRDRGDGGTGGSRRAVPSAGAAVPLAVPVVSAGVLGLAPSPAWFAVRPVTPVTPSVTLAGAPFTVPFAAPSGATRGAGAVPGRPAVPPGRPSVPPGRPSSRDGPPGRSPGCGRAPSAPSRGADGPAGLDRAAC